MANIYDAHMYHHHTHRDSVEADVYGLLFDDFFLIIFFLHLSFVCDWFYFRLFLTTEFIHILNRILHICRHKHDEYMNIWWIDL